jgi:hypothetical protein
MRPFGALRLPLLAGLVHDPDLVRRTAERIVGAPPYRDTEVGIVRRTLQRILDTLGAALGDALGAIGGTPALAWAIAVVGLVVLGAVVWRATRGASLGGRGDRVVPLPGSDRSAASWQAEAEAHLAAGHLEAALRARYAAAVVTLLERGLIEDVPGRTIRELDRELSRAAPALAPVLATAGERVERVVFGDEPATQDDLEVAGEALAAAARTTAGTQVGAGA